MHVYITVKIHRYVGTYEFTVLYLVCASLLECHGYLHNTYSHAQKCADVHI